MIAEIAVVIPAADEESSIGACLQAVHQARARVSAFVRTRVVVVLDACSDRTAEVVAADPMTETVHSTARRVGVARALGTAHAVSSAPTHGALWLAHTDADSVVPPNWLAHMLAAAQDGADVVLGTVVPGNEIDARRHRAWDLLHTATDGHPHVHGANLGIRADVLAALGGWRPLATGEDVDLAGRAVAAGVDVRRTGAIPVLTSARPTGRAPGGFSSYLRLLG